MTRLPHETYIDHIRAESTRIRDVLATTDPGARVPTAPEWTAADLLSHLGNVQDHWTRVLRARPAEAEHVERERPATYAELLVLFDTTHAAFVDALDHARPEEPAWNWSGTEQTVSFIVRRQAHEALIHRLDAELASAPDESNVTPLDPRLALDGVEETIAIMYGGVPPWGSFAPLPHHIELRATDQGASVWTRLGLFSGTSPSGTTYADEMDINVVEDPGTPADAVVSGTADDLDAWLWHRRDDARITVTGDQGSYAHLRKILDQPID